MKLRRIILFAAPFAMVLALSSAAAVAQAPQPAAQAEPAAESHGAEASEAGEGHAHHPEVKLFGRSLGTMAQFGVTVFNFALFAGILGLPAQGRPGLGVQGPGQGAGGEAVPGRAGKGRSRPARSGSWRPAWPASQQELEGIMAKADADAEAEKQRIIDSAKAEAAQILAQTGAEIEAQARQAEAALRALVAELVVAGAARAAGEPGEGRSGRRACWTRPSSKWEVPSEQPPRRQALRQGPRRHRRRTRAPSWRSARSWPRSPPWCAPTRTWSGSRSTRCWRPARRPRRWTPCSRPGGPATTLRRFFGVVAGAARLNLIYELAGAFDELVDERLGVVEATVQTAQPLTAPQSEALTAAPVAAAPARPSS